MNINHLKNKIKNVLISEDITNNIEIFDNLNNIDDNIFQKYIVNDNFCI